MSKRKTGSHRLHPALTRTTLVQAQSQYQFFARMTTRCNISDVRMREVYVRLLRKTEAEAILIYKSLKSTQKTRLKSTQQHRFSEQLQITHTIKQHRNRIESHSVQTGRYHRKSTTLALMNRGLTAHHWSLIVVCRFSFFV